MALALRGPQFVTPEVNVADFQLAADLDLRVTMHAGDGYWGKSGPIRKMHADGCSPTASLTCTAARWVTTS